MSGITYIKRIEGSTNNLVVMTTSDNTATATAANYITAQTPNITALNEGAWSWNTNDEIHLSASDGISICSINSTFTTLTNFSGTGSGDVTYTNPSIANHLAVFTNTTGNISQDVATAINQGNIQAGLSGHAGTLISFPATASKGSLIVAGVANTGNTNTTISNAAMGQASVISIPDPGAATANFLLNSGAQSMAAGASIGLDKGTGTVTTGAVTVNKQAGVITAAVTTVAAATTSVTFNNSEITSASVLLVSLMGGTNTTLPGPQVNCVYTSPGVATINITNNNVAGTALNGNLLIGFAVL